MHDQTGTVGLHVRPLVDIILISLTPFSWQGALRGKEEEW